MFILMVFHDHHTHTHIYIYIYIYIFMCILSRLSCRVSINFENLTVEFPKGGWACLVPVVWSQKQEEQEKEGEQVWFPVFFFFVIKNTENIENIKFRKQ